MKIAEQQEQLSNVESALTSSRSASLEEREKYEKSLLTLRKHFNRTLISYAQQERLSEQARISECAARPGSVQAGLLGAQTKFGGGTESEAIDAAMRAIAKQRKAVEKIKKAFIVIQVIRYLQSIKLTNQLSKLEPR